MAHHAQHVQPVALGQQPRLGIASRILSACGQVKSIGVEDQVQEKVRLKVTNVRSEVQDKV